MSSFVRAKKLLIIFLAITASLLVVAACGNGEDTPTPQPTATPQVIPPTPTPITLPPTPTPVTLPSVDPEVVISPVGVLKEGSLTIHGSGFAASENVTILIVAAGSGGTNVSLGNALANASGAFSQDFTLPTSVQVGVWTVKAEGSARSRATTPIVVLEVPK